MITSNIRLYSVIAGLIVIALMLMPAFALSSLTNLPVLALDTDIFLYNGPIAPNDGYAYGNCTYWVSLLRAEATKPIPNTWGNAITWASNAQSGGYLVNQTPTPTSIMVDVNAPGGLGHVAYVESVNATNGDWTISEMNRVGFDEVDTRVMPAASALSYYFIHDKLL